MVVYRSIGVGGLEFELSPLNFHFKKVKKISHVGSYFFFWGGGGEGGSLMIGIVRILIKLSKFTFITA